MQTNFKRTALSAALVVAFGGANAAPVVVNASPPAVDTLAAASRDPNLILLRAGAFDPRAETLNTQSTGAVQVAESRYVIVQFSDARLQKASALEVLGVEVLGYIPNNAYLVRLNGKTADTLRALPSVRWVGSWQPGMKLDPQLWGAERPLLAANEFGKIEIEISLFAGESVDRIVAALRKLVPSVEFTNRIERAEAPRLRLVVDRATLDQLLDVASRLDGVAWIDRYLMPETRNSGAIAAIQGNATGALGGSGAVGTPTPMWDHSLFGTGQIVALADSGLDRNEAYFTTLNQGAGDVVAITDSSATVPPAVGPMFPTRKIFAYWVQPGAAAYDNGSSFHGTHTSGTVVGDASGVFASTFVASTPTAANHEMADGMAPNAQLLFQDIGGPSGLSGLNDLRGTIEQAYAGGARLHSDSWGASDFGDYNGNDNDVDYTSWTLRDYLFIVAAGNDGDLTAGAPPDFCPPAQVVGAVCTRSVGSPGNSKNALTVGALGHAGSTTVIGFSSRGPTTDGRIKPDIMAPGTSTVSAAGDTNNASVAETPANRTLSGTSMATPTVAGNSALMRQFFTEGWYPRGSKTAADTLNPSGMAMKAILLNGTNTISAGEFGGMNYGWGRAWMDGSLWFATTLTGGNDSRRMRLFERTSAAGLRTGEQHEYTIQAVAAGQELRATLTWFDPEATPGAAITLVNNLNLEVTAPDLTVYKGNVFSGGGSVTGGVADTLNTVEQARFIAPAAGLYRFRVIAPTVPGIGRNETDAQGYALAVSGAFGLPDVLPAYAAPTGLTVASNGAAGIGIGFTAAGGAQGFQLYRANGTCASAAAGDFRLVASGAASPLVDDRSQGGVQYAYKVRGIRSDVEGDISGCIDAVSADTCSLRPNFNESSITTDGNNAACRVRLNWAAAAAACPTATTVTYDVFRSTSPTFSSPVQVGTSVVGTQFDNMPVLNGTPYYYRVAAKDNFGNSSIVNRIVAETPAGPTGPDPLTFLDDVDTHTYMTLQDPWHASSTAASAGTYSYSVAPDGLTYGSNICVSMETPTLTVPAAGRLTFKARYDIEIDWDGVVLEYSTDGGANWLDLPPDGGYPNDFSATGSPPGNACGYIASHGAFNGKTTAASNSAANEDASPNVFKPFTRDLASLSGQNVKFRWRFSSDGGAEFNGFWLDEVRLGATDFLFKDGFEFSPFACQ